MADEGQTDWRLNLDVDDAMSNVSELHNQITDAMSTDSLSELISKFGEVGLALGVLGAAFLAIKETMDLVFDGEQIDQVNQSFQMLTANAGLSGDAIKEAMEKASGGLIDDTQLLKDANSAIVELGTSAKDLGPLMEIARQATAVMGGDINQNFQQITQAIASGQTRSLIHMGIIIDSKKAYEDYAASIGLAVGELSKADQAQAMMNAVLQKGKTAYEGVNVNITEAANAQQTLKAAVIDLKDALAEAFSAKEGSLMAAFFSKLTDAAHGLAYLFKGEFGSSSDQLKKKIDDLNISIQGQYEIIHRLQTGHKSFWDYFSGGASKAKQIEIAKGHITEMMAELDKLNAKKEKDDNAEKARTEALTKVKEVQHGDAVKIAADRLKFQEQVTKLQEQELTGEQKEIAQKIKDATSEGELDSLQLARKKNIQAQIQNLEMQGFLDHQKLLARTDLTVSQRATMEDQLNKQRETKYRILTKTLAELDNNLEDERIQMLHNYAAQNNTSASAIAAEWKATSRENLKSALDFQNATKTGMSTLTSSVTSGFTQMAQSGQLSATAMLQSISGALGQQAISQGTIMLLSSIWPPNPAAAAGGSALIALGMALTAAGGGGTSGTVTTTSPSTTGAMQTSTSAVSTTGTAAPSLSASQTAGPKNVNLTIQGNYYDSNDARLALMDQLRQATDAQDFNYFKVGGQ